MKNFFNNLGKTVEDLFGKAQTAVESTCERFELQRDIETHRNELEKLFAELGRYAYHGNADVAGVRDASLIRDDIANVSSALQSMKEELEEMTAKNEEDVPEVVEKRYCHKCGALQSEENDFCHKCGTKLHQ